VQVRVRVRVRIRVRVRVRIRVRAKPKPKPKPNPKPNSFVPRYAKYTIAQLRALDAALREEVWPDLGAGKLPDKGEVERWFWEGLASEAGVSGRVGVGVGVGVRVRVTVRVRVRV